jgi:hypothetical protein
MFFALRRNWGTHYDALPPDYNGPTELWPKYLMIGVIPQMLSGQPELWDTPSPRRSPTLEVPTGSSPMYILRGDHWRNMPRPFRRTVYGLPGALSVIETEAVRTPCAVGVNVTVIETAPARWDTRRAVVGLGEVARVRSRFE